MIPAKAAFVIFVLVSGVIFTPSYSFAQSDRSDNPLSSFFDIFRQLFSFNDQSESVDEFGDAAVVHTSSTTTTESNIPPTANAGPDQEVLEFVTVTLNGTSSTDVDGQIVAYQWTQVSDPKVILSSNSTATSTFTAPEVSSDNIKLRFSLLVTDNLGDSSSDEVEITVKKVESIPDANIPPTANAGPDQEVLEFATVTLNGTSSTDVDGTITNYLWSQLSGANVTLSSLSDVTPTFTAPIVDAQDVLKFLLTVTDNIGASSSDEVEITVNDSDNNDDNNNDDNNNDDNNNDDNNNDDNNNEIEIEVEVNKNTKIKVKIGEDEYKFTLPGELTDDQIIQFISDELDLDEDLVREIIEIHRESNDVNDKKVTICHIPPGNENNPQTIMISSSALNAHLAHGDTVGECTSQSQNFKNNNSERGNSDHDNSGKGNTNDSESEDDSENENKNTKSSLEENDDSKEENSESKSQNNNKKQNNKKDD